MAASVSDDFVFPWPWSDLRCDDPSDARVRDGLVSEFRKEMGDVPLAERNIVAVAMFNRQDEVVFCVDGSEYAVVHLTWAMRQDRGVTIRWFPDWTTVTAEVVHMADEW